MEPSTAQPLVTSYLDQPPYDWLPKHACHKDIRPHIERSEDPAARFHTVPLGLLCGPGVLWAQRGAFFLWTFWLVLPFVAYNVIPCSDASGCELWNSYKPPNWLKFCVFVPVCVVSMAMEEMCLRYVIAVQLQTTQKKQFKFLGGLINFSNHSYYLWRFMMLGLSFIGKGSIYANSMFVVRVWKIEDCDIGSGTASELEAIWAVVSSQALFPLPTFRVLVTLMWVFMSFQLFYAVLIAFPIGKKVEFKSEHYKRCKHLCARELRQHPVYYGVPKDLGDDVKGKNFQYSTWMDPGQNHGAACMAMADAARMPAVTFQDGVFARTKMEGAEAHIALGKAKTLEKCNYLHVASHQIGHGIGTFLLVGLLECAFQINVQISFMGILSQAAAHDCMELLTMAAIAFNIVKMFEKALTALSVRSLYSKVKASVETWDPPLDDRAEKPQETDSDERKQELMLQNQAEHEWRLIQNRMKRFWCYVVVYFLAVIYAGYKLVGYNVCASHLINFPGGCVHINATSTGGLLPR